MPPVQCVTWGQPLLAQMLLRVSVASAFHGQGLSPFVAAHISVWSHHVRQAVLECSLGSDWGVHWDGCRKPVSHPHNLNPPSPLCFGWTRAFVHYSCQESRLPSVILLVPLAFNPVKGTHVPFVRTQSKGTQYVSPFPHSSLRVSTHVMSLFLLVPSQDTDSNLIMSHPFLPDSMWIFLTALVTLEFFC